jgi:hypothetical protein
MHRTRRNRLSTDTAVTRTLRFVCLRAGVANGRFQVAMDDAFVVSSFKCIGDLLRVVQKQSQGGVVL